MYSCSCFVKKKNNFIINFNILIDHFLLVIPFLMVLSNNFKRTLIEIIFIYQLFKLCSN